MDGHTLVILISSNGLFFGFTGTLSIWSSVDSAPSITLFISFFTRHTQGELAHFPKIEYFPSRLVCFAYVMKNWFLSFDHEKRTTGAYLCFISIGTSICHSYNPPSIELVSATPSQVHEENMTHLESLSNLIIKRSSPYTLTSLSSPCWISTLNHESLDITVKEGIVICPWCS
jgi:hypothetical protein